MKKKLFIVALVICLIAVVACGSLAYFTATSSKTNTFMIASSDDEEPETPDEIFSVSVTETTGSEYKEAVPGKVFDKDPKITNTGMYDQWLRVTITISNGDKWLAADNSLNTPAKVFDALIANVADSCYDAAKWVREDPTGVDADKNLVYTFYYKDKFAPEDEITIFDKVQIPACLDSTDMVGLTTFTVTVKADAIQADNTLGSAKATFEDSTYWSAE